LNPAKGKAFKVLSVLQLHTAIIFGETTKVQYAKAKESITKPYTRPVKWAVKDRELITQKVRSMMCGMFPRRKTRPFNFTSLQSGVSPTFYRQGSKPEKWLQSFSDDCCRGTPFGSILSEMGAPQFVSWNGCSFHAGRIVFLQERGGKARVVACPTAGAQVAFKPLHVALSHTLASLKQDCTFDQNKGVLWCSEQLKLNKKLFSFDLSSATDRFPFEVQLDLLGSISSQYAKILADFVRNGTWAVDVTVDNKRVRDRFSYAVGQPMGLYGSFPLFALTHHAIILSLWEKMPHFSTPNQCPYVVLGDDVVIGDEELAARYLSLVTSLGVDVSMPKSNASNRIAQFAGKLITSSGVIDSAKIPVASSGLENCFDQYLRVIGWNGLANLPARVRRVAKLMAQLPSEMGGLGLNPHGRALDDRLACLETDKVNDFIPGHDDLGALAIKGLLDLSERTDLLATRKTKVLSFINDQLMETERVLKALLGQFRNLPTNVRQLAYQLGEVACDDAMIGLSFTGTLHTRSDKPFKSLLEIWKQRLVMNNFISEETKGPLTKVEVSDNEFTY
jgi:hypothetical protein